MFGQNEVKGPIDLEKLQVREVFYTIQGEGPFAGQPAVFIRLTGCNYRCWFCDTQWDDDNDSYMRPRMIARQVEKIAPAHCKLVVLTGGEPTRQQLADLILCLLRRGFHIQIETAGSYWQDCMALPGVSIVVSPKTHRVHKELLQKRDNIYWKYVINENEVDPNDGLPSAPMQRVGKGEKEKIGGGIPCRPPEDAKIYVSPCDEYDRHKNEANLQAVVKSCMKYGYIALPQLHKIFSVE